MKKMYKISALVVAICLILTLPAFAAEPVFKANSNQNLSIDGEIRTYELPVANYGGYTMLPLRALVTDLGIPNDDEHIQYDSATKAVTLISADGGTKIWLQQGNPKAWVEKDGEKTDLTLDCPVYNHEGNLYIPVKFVAESLDMLVTYDQPTRTVLIRTPESIKALEEAMAVSESAEQPTKLRMLMDGEITVSIGDEKEIVPMAGDVKADVSDLSHMKMSMEMTSGSGDKTLPIQIYLDGETAYISMLGMNLKTSSAEAGASPENILKITELLQTSGLAETLQKEMYARLFAKPGEEGTVIVSGDISFIYSDTVGIMNALGIQFPSGAGIKVNKYWIEMVIDTETGLPMAMTMDANIDMSELGSGVMEMTMSMTYSYDDVEIVIPQEIIDNAIEMPQ